MKISIKEKSGLFLVEISGSLDSSTAGDLEHNLKDLVPQHKNIVLDFTHVKYVSSAGLRAFINIQKQLVKNNNKMSIIHANDIVKEVIDVTGFGIILDVK